MKILYGVPSEGMGHATRSRVIISYLLSKGHDVKVVSSDRAYAFLHGHFGERVIPIEGFHLAYKNAEVSVGKTALLTLKTAPKNLLKNFGKYKEILSKGKPDIVISDFESFTYFFAKAHSIPLVSIDNMQVIDRCQLDIEIPKNLRSDYQLAKQIVNVKVKGATHYLISSFFYPDIKKAHTSYVAPILRDEIVNAKTSTLSHVLVYQTSNTEKELLPILQAIPQVPFIVYGLKKDKIDRNVTLKSFSEDGFIKDLSMAKAVIANGGFSFISEAVYLHKPICSVPITHQFEQFVNAAYIEKLGYGRYFDSFTVDGIKSFLFDLPLFEKALMSYQQNGNKKLFQQLGELLESIYSAAKYGDK